MTDEQSKGMSPVQWERLRESEERAAKARRRMTVESGEIIPRLPALFAPAAQAAAEANEAEDSADD